MAKYRNSLAKVKPKKSTGKAKADSAPAVRDGAAVVVDVEPGVIPADRSTAINTGNGDRGARGKDKGRKGRRTIRRARPGRKEQREKARKATKVRWQG